MTLRRRLLLIAALAMGALGVLWSIDPLDGDVGVRLDALRRGCWFEVSAVRLNGYGLGTCTHLDGSESRWTWRDGTRTHARFVDGVQHGTTTHTLRRPCRLGEFWLDGVTRVRCHQVTEIAYVDGEELRRSVFDEVRRWPGWTRRTDVTPGPPPPSAPR